MTQEKSIQTRFIDEVLHYDSVIRRICFMYSSNAMPFDDLYQETMVNLWRGFPAFRGESSLSTWVYRTTINSCITWYRRNRRHFGSAPLDDSIDSIMACNDDEHRRDLADMYKLISQLDPLEKAIIMMWLDERSYDDIAEVTGLSHGAVATRLHRIRRKLSRSENQH